MSGSGPSRPEDEDEEGGTADSEARLDASGDRPAPRLAFEGGADGFAGRLKQVRVAAILDDFSYAALRPECDLRQLTPSGWHDELESFRPEMLLVESAWRGKDEVWQGRIAKLDRELIGVIRWCRERDIPTVFWNKEDPVHFRTFKRVAKRFDYVFTTDIDSIARYKAVIGHDRAYLLPFFCQPRVNNPIERTPRKDAFSFAGSYYARYPERARDFREIVTAVAKFRPVAIYDRGQGADDARYRFPPDYAPLIVGTLPFERIEEAYKGYRYGLNFNSIKQSQSMLSRRVFELLASNTIVVSNYARSLRLMFGDLVIASDNGDTILSRLAALAGDDATAARFRLAALRKAIAEHTAEDRFAYVVGKVAGVPVPRLTPPFVVVAAAADQAGVDGIVQAFRRQTYAAKGLVLVVPDGFLPAGVADLAGLRVVSMAEAGTLRAADIASPGAWIAPMSGDDYYGPNYLLDLALATRYAPGPVIGKAAHYAWSAAERVRLVAGDTYRVAGTVPARAGAIRADRLTVSLGELLSDLATRPLTDPAALSLDPFNYCRGAAAGGDDIRAVVDDLAGLDAGMSFAELTAIAETVAPVERDISGLPRLTGAELAPMFRSARFVKFAEDGGRLRVESTLESRQRRYRYANVAMTPAQLHAGDDTILAHMIVVPGLHLRVAMRFLDAAEKSIGTAAATANRDVEFDLPEGTALVQIGVRVSGPGAAFIPALLLDHRAVPPVVVLTTGHHLIVTDHYPGYDAPGTGIEVHQAALAAKGRGSTVDVFRLAEDGDVAYHEYGGIDCITGPKAALAALVAAGHHRSAELGFPDREISAMLATRIAQADIVTRPAGARQAVGAPRS